LAARLDKSEFFPTFPFHLNLFLIPISGIRARGIFLPVPLICPPAQLINDAVTKDPTNATDWSQTDPDHHYTVKTPCIG
jgi:hypothetical protein